MPELPDVEARKSRIESFGLGEPLKKVLVRDERILEGIKPTAFSRALKGAEFTSVKRRGKYLLVATNKNSTLLLHFGMTGDIVYTKKGEPAPPYSRVEFIFDKGSLHYTNLRMIGKVSLFPTLNEDEIEDVSKLGPEPLDRKFTYARFREALRGTKTTIHQALMDQERIAGIGNIYSDEIAFQAGINPERPVDKLSEEEIRALYEKTKWTLKRAIALNAELEKRPDLFIIPHRKKNGACPKCGTVLKKVSIGGRSSYYCPRCQK